MIAWLKVIGLGLTKWPAKLAAPFVVLFLDEDARNDHPIFGVQDALDLSWWNIGVRNAAHNMLTIPQPRFTTKGNTTDETLEGEPGFQWRYRRSTDGKYVSFRCTWGQPDPSKGKDEFYVGWTMNEQPYARLTFFQLRPAWPLFVLFALFVLYGCIS